MPLNNPIQNSDLIQPGTNNLYMTPAEKAAIANGTAINNGTIKRKQLETAISGILTLGKNKYNINDVDFAPDTKYDTSGVLDADATQNTTGYIPIRPGETLRSSINGLVSGSSWSRSVFFDLSKVRTGGVGGTASSATAPASAVYVRVSVSKTVSSGLYQLEIGSAISAYEAVKFNISTANLNGTWDTKTPLPLHMRDEISRVEALTVNTIGDFRYLFDTDSHVASTLYEKKIQQAAEMNSIGALDVIIDGGDMAIGQTTRDGSISLMRSLSKTIKGSNSDVICVRGNHDVYAVWNEATPDDYTIKTAVWSNIFCNHQRNKAVFDAANPQGGYYYKDYDSAKIRVIALNTCDTLDKTGHWLGASVGIAIDDKAIQQAQFTWFCTHALDFTEKGADKTNWGVITLGHSAVVGASYTLSLNQPSQFLGVLTAFIAGSTYAATTDAGTAFQLISDVDFSTQGAMEYITHHCGDAHWDIVSYIPYGSVTVPYIRTANMGNLRKTTTPTDYPTSGDIFTIVTPARGAGGWSGDDTAACELMDVFCVNRITKTITSIRYGAGANRIIPYKTRSDVVVAATITLTSVLTGTLTWATLNASVATVADGVVTGVIVGQAVITATDSNGVVEAWCMNVTAV